MLALARCQLPATGAELLLDALCSNKALTSVELTGIALRPELVESAVCQLIEANHLSRLQLTLASATARTVQLLHAAMQRNTALEALETGHRVVTASLSPLLQRNRTEKERQRRRSQSRPRGAA